MWCDVLTNSSSTAKERHWLEMAKKACVCELKEEEKKSSKRSITVSVSLITKNKKKVEYFSVLLAALPSASLCCWLLAGAQRNSLVASVNITFRITAPEPPRVDLTQFLGPRCVACGSNG